MWLSKTFHYHTNHGGGLAPCRRPMRSTRERGVHREWLSQQDRRARNSAGGRSYCPESKRRCTSGRISGGKNERSPTIVAAKSTLVSPPQKIHVLRPACIFWERATLLLRSSSLPLGHDAAPPPAAPLRVKCRAVTDFLVITNLHAILQPESRDLRP